MYKLSAIRDAGGPWEYRIKLSEQAVKISNPGVLQVRRFRQGDGFVGDAIHNVAEPVPDRWVMVDPMDATRRKKFPADAAFEDLLVPVVRDGDFVYEAPPLEAIRARTREQLAGFHDGVKRFLNPHQYPVGLEKGLFDLKTRLIMKARGLEE